MRLDFASEHPPQIDHAHETGATRIERQVLESPSRVEAARAVFEWMCVKYGAMS